MSNEEILNKAKDLGKAIKESEEYKKLLEAQKALDEDKETQDLLNEYNAKAQEIQIRQMTGENVNDSMVELQNLERKIMDSESMKKYTEAENDFKNLIDSANKAIVDAMEEEEEQKE
jgi:cell fate (sporulation/competence/biofilm development) regulator YlbF (YheA/YmcA/DUF963 family)